MKYTVGLDMWLNGRVLAWELKVPGSIPSPAVIMFTVDRVCVHLYTHAIIWFRCHCRRLASGVLMVLGRDPPLSV